MQHDVAGTRVLKKSQIFSKNAKFTLTLMSKEKLDFFYYKFRFYTEVCMKFAFIVTCSAFLDSGWIMDNEQCDLIILSIFLIKQFYHIFFPFRSILHQIMAFHGFWNLKKIKICVSWNVDIKSLISMVETISIYSKVPSSRPVYYSFLDYLGQRLQYISIKFPLHKQSENLKMCY